MMSRQAVWAVFALGWLVACGKSEARVASQADAHRAQRSDKHAPAIEEVDYLGVVSRAALNERIGAGLGALLAHVQLEPVASEGRAFEGFRVVSVDPDWHELGIAVDDVITRLNGQTLERPEQAVAAVQSLRVASEIKLEVIRAGARTHLRYLIE